MNDASLIIVGTGINVGHLTQEARGWISIADKVLYLVTDPTAERLITCLNNNSESLHCYYGEDKVRSETYKQMCDRTIECLREGGLVCVVYYGHPGFFVNPAHAAIKAAKAAGFPARMLPGVSSLDCLFCDLGVDATGGLQVFELTDFVLRDRPVDIYSNLVLVQVSALGERHYSPLGWKGRYCLTLKEKLLQHYAPQS